MATMKACVQKIRKDGFYPVYIRVTHNRTTQYIKTDKIVTKRELSKSKDITDPFVLKYCSSLILEYFNRLNRVNIKDWDCKMIVDYLLHDDEDLCFSDYARKYIDNIIDEGKDRNAHVYKVALQHLESFLGTTKVKFSQLTSKVVEQWIKSMEGTKRIKELYPVCIRHMFRAAIEEYNDYDTGSIRIKTNPWIKVKIPRSDRPEQRAISAEDCRKFFAAPLLNSPLSELGRDVAMMVLCLAGINAIDLFNLKKTDYYNGIIHYRRAKTMRRSDGAYFEMRVPEILKPLFDKYKSDDEYLFNFRSRHTSSDCFTVKVNIGIRRICKSMNIKKEDRYSVYTFRHTWGTVAQNDCGASLSEVGFGMNHAQNKITRGYVKLDFTPAWELNERVIDFILFSDQASKQVLKHKKNSNTFSLSPKMLIKAAAFFQGKCLASFEDIGYSNVDDIISRLTDGLSDVVPDRSLILIKIVDCESGKVAIYERQRGKDF